VNLQRRCGAGVKYVESQSFRPRLPWRPIFPVETTAAGRHFSYKACAYDCCSAGGKENAVRNDNTALASGVALLAATQLPAKVSPTFDLKSSTSMLQLWVAEAAVVAEAGLTLAAVE
jgi:hypothetical protein